MVRWCDENPMDRIRSARPGAPRSRLLLNPGEMLAKPEQVVCDR